MSDLPRLVLTIEIEASPRVELRAEDADLTSLVRWLSDERVREHLDALVTLYTGRDYSGEG